MAKKHRQYENDYVSVTTLLALLINYGLMEWFKRTPYAQIIQESNRGKEIGTQVHQVIQDHIEAKEAKIDTEFPDEVTNILKSFMLFKKENPHILLKKSEIVMKNDIFRLNGTMDCIGDENGKIVVVDWKSGKCGDKLDKPPIYDSYLYQISAYGALYELEENLDISGGYVVSLAKDKISYNLQYIDMNKMEDNWNNIILPLLKIYYYQKPIKGETNG